MRSIWILAVLLMLLPLSAHAHVDIFDFEDGQILHGDSLQANLDRLDGGLDDMLELVDFGDSLTARASAWYSLGYQGGFEGSPSAVDSLSTSVVADSPIGDAQNLFIENAQGTVQNIYYYMDVTLPYATSILDSIRYSVWTEATNNTDQIVVQVFEDSLVTGVVDDFESLPSLDAAAAYSSSARTKRIYGVGMDTDIVGGTVRFRLTLVFAAGSDSMFVGPIYYHLTNP